MVEEKSQVPSNSTTDKPIPEEPDQEDGDADHENEDRAVDHDDDTMIFYPPPKIDLEPKNDPELPNHDPEGRRARDAR
jgi:hypothetical protein